MNKIMALFLIFFSLNLFSYEFQHSLLPDENDYEHQKSLSLMSEEHSYTPYTGGEVFLETAIVLGVTALSWVSGFALTSFNSYSSSDDAWAQFGDGVINAFIITMIFSPLSISIVGNSVFDRDGSILGGYLGMASIFALYSSGNIVGFMLGYDCSYTVLTFLSVATLPIGLIMGNAISQKKSQFDRGSLVFNTAGTILGSVVGMGITAITKDSPEYNDDSYKHYLPILLSTTLTSMGFLSISRTSIADEPDNAGTYLGVGIGTLAGGLFGIIAINIIGDNLTDGDKKDYGYPVSVSIGALLGSIAGFAASHTTVLGREMKKKNDSVSVTLLPPAMIPERVPFINKKFTSWSILNLQLNF